MTCKLFINIQYKNYTVINALKEHEKLEKEEEELQIPQDIFYGVKLFGKYYSGYTVSFLSTDSQQCLRGRVYPITQLMMSLPTHIT
jgi:hypothetical protein